MVLEGVVTNVAAFGAFVDIGVHQDGLVHVSAMSRSFVKDPREVVKPGDVVRVKVLDVDVPRKRISLTLRLEDDTTPGRRPDRDGAAPSERAGSRADRGGSDRAGRDGGRGGGRDAGRGGGGRDAARDAARGGGGRDAARGGGGRDAGRGGGGRDAGRGGGRDAARDAARGGGGDGARGGRQGSAPDTALADALRRAGLAP
jgi:uncharacterized protein